MLDKISTRLRLMMLISVLAVVVFTISDAPSVGFAQGETYYCPPEFTTCLPDPGPMSIERDPNNEGGGVNGEAPCDKAGGEWKCPVASVEVTGTGGSGTCTSDGCRKSPAGFWVCRFIASNSSTKCEPLLQCDCR